MPLPKQIKSHIRSSGGGVSDTVAVFDYTSSTGFTYTSSEVEFGAGGATLKNQFDASVVFAATYATTPDLTYSKYGGDLTGTDTGTVSNSGGKLILSAAGAKRVDYDPQLNFAIKNIASIKLKVTPRYTGSPASNQYFFCSGTSTLADTGRCSIMHLTNGNVCFTAQSANDGANILIFAAWSATDGVEEEFCGEMNFTTGEHRFFREGALIASTLATTGVRGSGAAILRTGTSDDEALEADFDCRELIVRNETLETAAYTPGYTVPATPYLTTGPTIETSTGILAVSSIVSVDVVYKVAGSDLVKAQVKVGAQLKYWNGAAWVNSDGTLAQSSTVALMESNIATLTTGGSTIKFVFLLDSDTGYTTPTLSSLTVEYV